MKSPREHMEIVNAYELVDSYRGAAKLCGTTHKTVKRIIERRDMGEARRRVTVTNTSNVQTLIAERVRSSDGRISAKRLLPMAQAAGYTGSARNLRRAVADAKAAWKRQRRTYRPWVPTPGEHLAIDWAAEYGWQIFCAVLAWSRYRFVRFAADQRRETTLALLAECFAELDGVPAVVLSDRMACLKATLQEAVERERVESYAGRSKSAATIKAYAAGWRDFLSFLRRARTCRRCPPRMRPSRSTCRRMADRGAKAATIARRLVVIAQAHKGADLPTPTTSSLVRRVHAGIRRTIGTAQARQSARPRRRSEEDARQIAGHSRRAAAIARVLLLGFAGAFRRTELVSLDVADLEFSSRRADRHPQKIEDRPGGRQSAHRHPLRLERGDLPCAGIRDWLETARISEGAVFRPLDRFQRVQPTSIVGQGHCPHCQEAGEGSRVRSETVCGTRCGPGWPPVLPRREPLSG